MEILIFAAGIVIGLLIKPRERVRRAENAVIAKIRPKKQEIDEPRVTTADIMGYGREANGKR